MGCGADTEANELLPTLTEDFDFEIPNIDISGPEFEIPGGIDSPIYGEIIRIENSDLTSGSVGGTGVFDILMSSFAAHLKAEFNASRITGAEYTKAYVALTGSAMSQAVQFLLQRDQAFWASQNAQILAIKAKTELETVKVQLALMQYQAATAKAEYARTKMQMASESMAYCIAKYNLENILPNQKVVLDKQIIGLDFQNDIAEFNLEQTMPAQLELINEQIETQRSQTLDTRTDTTPVTGTVGKQKELFAQQIISYKRDAENKAAKIFTDAWTVMKTIDEGLLPPDGFENSNIDEVLTTIKTNNEL